MAGSPRPRSFAPLALGALLVACGAAGRAEEEDPAARARRVELARRAAEEEARAFARRVDGAIQRGSAWLATQQGPDGLFRFRTLTDSLNYGRQALALLALVKCGATERDKAVRLGLQALRTLYDSGKPGHDVRSRDLQQTYGEAVLVLLFEALHQPSPPPAEGRPGPRRPKPARLPRESERLVRPIVDWLVGTQGAVSWRYPGDRGAGDADEDVSNTQFALLALQAAARCGIEVAPEVYERALAYLLERQEADGPEETRWIENAAWEPGVEDRYGPFVPAGKARARGWRYLEGPNVPPTGSMTTAGIAGLAIVKERLRALGRLPPERARAIDAALLDGLAWLSRHWKADANPGQTGWHHYYLYGLERVGALLGTRFVGRHDWYREGAEVLLASQREDGSWPDAKPGPTATLEPPLEQTAFALLFLKRATVPPAEPLGPVLTGD